jgi:hypothetical protein
MILSMLDFDAQLVMMGENGTESDRVFLEHFGEACF